MYARRWNGLGDRDYYLFDDKRNKEVREAYKTDCKADAECWIKVGKDAKRIMTNVMKIETALADSAWTREQSRNIPAMYNPFTFAKLKKPIRSKLGPFLYRDHGNSFARDGYRHRA